MQPAAGKLKEMQPAAGLFAKGGSFANLLD